jgi:hypothetical protein
MGADQGPASVISLCNIIQYYYIKQFRPLYIRLFSGRYAIELEALPVIQKIGILPGCLK